MATLVGQGMPTAEAARVVLAPVEHGLALPPAADPVAHHLAAAALELDGPACRRLLRRHVERHPVERTWCNPSWPRSASGGTTCPTGSPSEHLLAHIAAAVRRGDD